MDTMDARLIVNVGGSSLGVDWAEVGQWRTMLNCADGLALARNGSEAVRVDLGGQRRWVAFAREVNGSPLACIGYQETVGARRHGDRIVGGSNRKVLAWLHPSGRVTIGEV